MSKKVEYPLQAIGSVEQLLELQREKATVYVVVPVVNGGPHAIVSTDIGANIKLETTSWHLHNTEHYIPCMDYGDFVADGFLFDNFWHAWVYAQKINQLIEKIT